MWILYAFGSAFFAGITAILSKTGLNRINSNLATALRTIVVLAFSWLMVFVTHSQGELQAASTKTLIFLILSGLATGAAWLCYYRALQLGEVYKVTVLDKSSTMLTLLLALIFLKEPLSLLKCVCILLIGVGTYMMIEKKDAEFGSIKSRSWFVWAVLSAIFSSLTAILGKIGIDGISSNLGTAVRTCVVLIMAWIVVFATKSERGIRHIDKKSGFFLALSGVATGASWLCYYKALKDGLASVVVSVDKLSILITIAFSYFLFKEKLSKKALIGLVLIVCGTLLMII